MAVGVDHDLTPRRLAGLSRSGPVRLVAFRTTTLEFSREQADVPAEQPAPREDARLSRAHADPCRSGDHLGAPAQGSRRTLRLIFRRRTGCFPPRTGCAVAATSMLPCARAVVPVGRRWSC